MSEKITRNMAVYLTYTIADEAGKVLEQVDIPVGYVHGAGSALFEQVESALDGRREGDEVEVTLTPDEAFGPHDPALTFTDDIDNVPPQYRYLGAEVEFENNQGGSMQFRVTRIEDGKLTIDGNHPMAGKTITFTVKVVTVRPATPDEIVNGRPADGHPQQLH